MVDDRDKSDADLKAEGKQTHDLRHCDDPGCCRGVIIGTCRRCGLVSTVGTECMGPKRNEEK